MTPLEFGEMRFGANMKCLYTNLGMKHKHIIYRILSVDFYEGLLEIVDNNITIVSDGDASWVRCENVELIP